MAKKLPYPGIDEYMAPYDRFFYRSEGRELAQRYIVGLMMEGERKSVEPMSVKVDGSERSMQRLLTDVKWDHEGVWVEYRRIMLEKTADPQGVLAADDTGFPKKGKHSACVARQYCPSTGKPDNCQIGVSVTYVGQEVAWTYGMYLFIPESWDNITNPECVAIRKKTRLPTYAHHLEKWKMVLDLIDIAKDDKVPYRAVVADSWYGSIPDFRRGLAERDEKFVVGVHKDQIVFLEAPIFEMPQPKKRGPGRPRVRKDINELIIQMAKENQNWGYTTIIEALANLGHTVAQGTVAKILQEHGIEPAPDRSKRIVYPKKSIRINYAMLDGLFLCGWVD